MLQPVQKDIQKLWVATFGDHLERGLGRIGIAQHVDEPLHDAGVLAGREFGYRRGMAGMPRITEDS